MVAVTLRGPYRLVSDVIGEFVPPGVPGVYVLGLVGSNSGFMFAPASTSAEAFEMECRLYHQYMLTGLRPHPLAPKDSALACPVCGLQG